MKPILSHNFNDAADELLSDFEFLTAKLQKKSSNQQTIRGLKEKARQGGYNGGPPPWGYKLVWTRDNERDKPKADLAVVDSEKRTILQMFELYVLYGGSRAAKELNDTGYRKPIKKFRKQDQDNGLFTPRYVLRAIQRPIYAGFMVWGRRKQSKNLRDYEPEWVYRPELQIVPFELWEEAQKVREKRRVNRAKPGARGQYPFTGLVICENCGGSMNGGILTNPKAKRAVYRCNNGHNYGQKRCPQPKTYSHKLITQAMIPFLTALITQQLGLDEVLTEAASAYGTTQTEEGLKEAIQAELYRIRDEKNRLLDSGKNDNYVKLGEIQINLTAILVVIVRFYPF